MFAHDNEKKKSQQTGAINVSGTLAEMSKKNQTPNYVT